MTQRPSNVAASVHARLLNQARPGGRSFNDLLQLYAMERFLYRLSISKYAGRFVLKGAMLLRVWDQTSYRTTRDIDLLGRVSNEATVVESIIRDVCEQEVDPDGLIFDPASVQSNAIVEDADYAGVRVAFRGALGNARLSMQLDIGFGDRITPGPLTVEFPVLLAMPAARLQTYPPETVVAEKFQVMLQRAEANSRMKDFHDIWWIADRFDFAGQILAEAIRVTCSHRDTPVPAEPTAFTAAFAKNPSKIAQWKAFRKRLNPTDCPEAFEDLVEQVARFLRPVAASIHESVDFDRRWPAGGPWS